jgi:hypothetical protein
MSTNSEKRSTTPTKTVTIDLGAALHSSKNIPHTPEFGDPYRDNGDAYERRQDVANQWEISDP